MEVLYLYFVNVSPAAVPVFLHHAVLLIFYWCNMELVGIAWMVRWEEFTYKTYDLQVLWDNHDIEWSIVVYEWCLFVWLYIKATPLARPFACFSLLSQSRFLSLTNFRLLSLITTGMDPAWSGRGGGCTGLKLCLSSTRGEFAAALRPDSTTAKFFAWNCLRNTDGCTWVILLNFATFFAFAESRNEFYSLAKQILSREA